MIFLKSVRTVSGLTALSRVCGLVRDIITIKVLSSFHTDALILAWTIPNLFRKLLGDGALASAFIAVFAHVRRDGSRERVHALVDNLITVLLLFLVGITLLLIIASFVIPEAWLLPLFQGDRLSMNETLALGRVLIPYMIVACILAQFQGILNSFGLFAIPAFMPVFLNLVWITAGFLSVLLLPGAFKERAFFLAGAIMFGAVMQLVLYVPSLKKQGMLPRPRFSLKNPDFRMVMTRMFPMALAFSATQVNILVDRFVARTFVPGDGGVTHLFLGDRLMQFPLALISIALTTTIYPLLAGLSANRDWDGVKRNLSSALRINLFLSIPAVVGLVFLAEPIVALFFEWGTFSSSDTGATGLALIGYVTGLPFLGTVILLNRAFFSMNRLKEPLVTSALLVAVNIVLDFILVFPLQEAGVAFATTITTVVQAFVLYLLLQRRLGRMEGAALIGTALRSCLLSLFMAAAVYGAVGLAGSWWPASPGASGWDDLVRKSLSVVLPVLAGIIVYFAPAKKLCPLEFENFLIALRGSSSVEDK